MSNLLNIVDENDEIIGQETRANIHERGLRHREIRVCFITPRREIIFQHRAKNKETAPDLLSFTVGGHVEIGQSYEEAALRETEEETGVIVKPADLIFLGKSQEEYYDEITDKTNKVFKTSYLYVYLGKISDLRVEPEEAICFEVYSLKQLTNLGAKERTRFVPSVFTYLPKIDWGKFLKDYPV
ncbi:MAG: NUDIX domain-containing protein [Patescibacteria group bacterium]|jgi:8-oxo-dGTP pyrophosphatase MutT (NUDIX family)